MPLRRQPETEILTFDGFHIPVKITHERRTNFRVALGKNFVLVRLPMQLSRLQRLDAKRWYRNWLSQMIEEKPEAFEKWSSQKYWTGKTINLTDTVAHLELISEKRKTTVGHWRAPVLEVRYPVNLPQVELNTAVRSAISRTLARVYRPKIERRVAHWNERHFGQPLGKVRLRYNHTNWGSCSRSGHISLSTRLLLTPPEVIDYVIVHELVHLEIFDHSDAFWERVASVQPDYSRQKYWLRTTGRMCDF